MKKLTFGSLFAGIGGFDLGFERAGMVGKWQVELNDYSRKVLTKHWPHVRRHDDVKTFPPVDTEIEEWRVDVICGGFPCQDISPCGPRVGITGSRSGLWTEFARIVRVLRPRYVVVENSGDLVHRGLSTVLGDLAEVGYDAEWCVLPACTLGAAHMRSRMFVLAYTDGRRVRQLRRLEYQTQNEARRQVSWPPEEPGIHRELDGVPSRVDRLKGIGNAVVPQVAEWVGRYLLKMHESLTK